MVDESRCILTSFGISLIVISVIIYVITKIGTDDTHDIWDPFSSHNLRFTSIGLFIIGTLITIIHYFKHLY